MTLPKHPPTATFGGAKLATAGNVGWSQTRGVTPHQRVFTVHETEWPNVLKIIKAGEPVDLVIDPDGLNTLTWKRLYALREVPNAVPMRRSFLVSDLRWLWQREIYIGSFNIPRRTGDRRLVGGEVKKLPVELLQGVDVYTYAYFSLKKDGDRRRKWYAGEVLEEVVEALAQKAQHGWRNDGVSVIDDEHVTVEGLDLADGGDSALSRALALVPRAGITVDSNGTAVLYDTTKRSLASSEAENAGGQTDQGDIDREMDLSALRPSAVRVFIPREVEVRFDSRVELDGGSSDQTNLDLSDMLMENVIPLPDPVTIIDGQEVTGGTYVPFTKALDVWNAELSTLGKPKAPPALTLENIRRFWFMLEHHYTPLGELVLSSAKASWSARIAAIRAHFRQTYRIPRPWTRRMMDMRAYRVGILDPFTGTKAPSQAWSEYCVEPTHKSLMLNVQARKNGEQYFWLNVDDYPGFTGELHDHTASPAVVQILDKDLGVIRIDYRLDPHGMRSQIHPSKMQDPQTRKLQAPTRDMSEQLRGVLAVDGAVSSTGKLWLSDEFRVAVVFTAMPAEPNNEFRYYRHTVNPGDVSPALASEFQITGGTGPVWNIVVPPSLLTAWYAWTRTVAARGGAELLFGFADNGSAPNEVPGFEIVNKDSLIPALANAFALSKWSAFVNQREGNRAVHWAPGARVVGNIDSVAHSLDSSGRLKTVIGMPPSYMPIAASAFIPQEARAAILRQITEMPG